MNRVFRKTERKKAGGWHSKLWARTLSMVLCICLVSGSVDLTALAAEGDNHSIDQQTGTITAFAALDPSVGMQYVTAGDDESAASFPETLSATVEETIEPAETAEPAETEEVSVSENGESTEAPDGETVEEPQVQTREVQVTVEWELDAAASTTETFDSTTTGNTYVYRPILQEEYRIAENVPLPEITIIIEAKPGERQVSIDGLTFSLLAEDGIIPRDVSLAVEKITDEAAMEQLCDDAIREVDVNNQTTGVYMATAWDLIRSYRIGLICEDGTSYDMGNAAGRISVQVDGIASETGDMTLLYHSFELTDAELMELDYNAEAEQAEFAMTKAGIYSFAGLYEQEEPMLLAVGNSSGDEDRDDYVYKVTRRTSTSFSVGDEIIFVPDSVGFVEEYSIGLPKESAILAYRKDPEKNGSYNKDSLNCYVKVIKASKGFDFCPYGSLNKKLTEYNCYAGGVRNLKGAVYDFVRVLQDQNVELTLQRDHKAWSGQKVELLVGADEFLELKEKGKTGVYRSENAPIGSYRIYVNGKDTGEQFEVVLDMTQPMERRTVDGREVFHFTNTQKKTIDFYTLSVQLKLDGEPTTALNNVSLNSQISGEAVYSATVDKGVWTKAYSNGVTEFYIPACDTNTYNICTNRDETGETWNPGKDQTTEKEISYHTLSIKTNLDGTLSGKPGTVSLRDADNNTVYTFTGDGVYTEKFVDGTNCTIYVNGESTGETISTEDRDKVLEFVRYEVQITDDAPWTDAEVELKQNGTTATMLTAEAADGNTVTYSKIWIIDDYKLYVDGLDTHKVLSGTKEKNTELTYYTSDVTVKGAPENPIITMTNGTEQYRFEGAGENWQRTHVLVAADRDGNEKEYKLTVKNTIANVDTIISSSQKTASLQFWKLDYYKLDTGTDTNTLMHTSYVLDHNVASAYGKVKIAGYSFSCWSEEPWSKGNLEIGRPFDFSQEITKDISLYANFEVPNVTIGEPVYTDANGNVNGHGPYYRMMNLTISGFDSGEEAIKYIFLRTTGTQKIILLSTDNIAVTNGVTEVPVSGGSVEIIPGTDKIAITFTNAVSMAAAQEFLRSKVVVEPDTDQEHVMTVEVSDASGQYVAINGVTATKQGQDCTKLANAIGGRTLNTGFYYLDSDVTFNGYYSGISGLTINGNVYIYIPKGKTLYAYGGSGSGQSTGGGAGIHVPSGSNLILLGEGKVYAQGGWAGDGGSGQRGNEDADWVNTSKLEQYHGGDGGAGGAGGAGAGAGIGTPGGRGGNSTSNNKAITYDAPGGGGGEHDGLNGSTGNAGSSALRMGGLYKDAAIIIDARGGVAGSGGSGGSATMYWDNGMENEWKRSWTGGRGGGGGGGGGGYAGANIGTGGTGGGSGGSGGTGGTSWDGTERQNQKSWQYANADGGAGGYGGNRGSNGSGSRCAGFKGKYGGYGGSGGGTNYTNANITSTPTTYTQTSSVYRTYTITFETTTGTAQTPDPITYEYGRATDITFPQYIDSNDNVNFYGWQLKGYGASGNVSASGQPFTRADATRYMAGEVKTLDPTTNGNLTFVAVTETIGGIRDDDTNSLRISPDNQETYYTYKVYITMDDEKVTRGTIKVGNKRLTPDTNGMYTFMTTNPDPKDIVINGETVGVTAAVNDENVSETTIAYESVKVRVTGKRPQSVRLTGAGAPGLAAENGENDAIEPYIYYAERLKRDESGEFAVLVDGEATGQTVSWGHSADIAYYTTQINLSTTGITIDEISAVELRDADGNALFLERSEGATENTARYVITRLASDTQYTVYINDERQNETIDFTKDRNIKLAFNKFTTIVTTSVDGVLTDRGTVKLGEEKMIRIKTGTYRLITSEDEVTTLSVDGTTVKDNVTPGQEYNICYYTVTYVKSDPQDSRETGSVPTDSTIYLENTQAVVKFARGLSNKGKTFGGWTYGGSVYQPGTRIPITAKTVLTAKWDRTDLGAAGATEVTLSQDTFTYNGKPQTPEVTVVYKGITLVEGEDYVLAYANTNQTTGRTDDQGSLDNAIDAGTVTITVKGMGDYTGSVTAEYEIEKKEISAQGIKAQDRVYDGTRIVNLMTGDVKLNGLIEGDEVSVAADAVGYLDNADVGTDKYVQVKAAKLAGAMASDYELEALEMSDIISINVTKKPLTEAMFTLDKTSVVYNGSEQRPEVTGSDKALVDGKDTNILTASDYGVTYTANVHAGVATVTLTAAEGGNYSGTVTRQFTITKAPLKITAQPATSVYGQDIAVVDEEYKTTDIYTEADRQDLAIKAVTSVKKGYAAGNYENAVTITYNTDNQDYEVTTESAEYTVTPSDALEVVGRDYIGVYDGSSHGISVTAKPYQAGEKISIYYSESRLTADNYTTGSTTPLTYKDAGSHTVYYYAVSGNYSGTAGKAEITIAKAPLTVTARTHTIRYGETVDTLQDGLAGVDISGFVAGDTAATALEGQIRYQSRDYLQFKDVGTYTIIPEGLRSDNYEIRYRTGELQVTARPVTFSWSGKTSLSYTGSIQGITATVKDAVNGDVVTVSAYENATATEVGTYTAVVKQLAGPKAGNYTIDAATAEQKWEITQAENAWTMNPSITGWSADGRPNDPSGAARFGESHYTYAEKPTSGDTVELDYKPDRPTTPGTYSMKAVVEATENYKGLETTVDFTITAEAEKPVLYIKAQDQTITYGEKLNQVVVSYTDQSGSPVSVKDGELTGNLEYVTSYKQGDPVNGKAGTYVLNTQGMTSDKYTLVYEPGELTVGKKTVALQWQADTTFTYTGEEKSVTATVDPESLVGEDAVTVASYDGNTAVNVGSYTAVAMTLTGTNADNYELPTATEQISREWSITRAENAFVMDPAMDDWYYGEEASEPVATAQFGKVTFKYQEVKEGAAGWTIFNPEKSEVPEKAGTYWLIAEVEADADGNYGELVSKEVKFTIAPAEVTVTAEDHSSEYGQDMQSLTSVVQVVKGKLTDQEKKDLGIVLHTTAEKTSAMGAYPVTVTTQANANIKVTSIEGTYRITPAQMKATAENVSVTYDGEPHTIQTPVITVNVNGEKLNPDVIYYSTEKLDANNYGSAEQTAPAITRVGEQQVYFYAVKANYTPVAGSSRVTITRKPVTVKANNAEITYGQDAVDNGVSFQGFVGADNATTLGIADAVSYAYYNSNNERYLAGSPVGTYNIVPTVDAEAAGKVANYTFEPEAGTLKVNKKALTADMFTVADASLRYDGTAKEPKVSVVSETEQYLRGADYTVTHTNNVNAGQDTAVATITATGDGNYKGTVTKSFSIAKCPVTVTAQAASSVYRKDIAALKYEVTEGMVAAGDDLKFAAVTSVKKGYAAGKYEKAVTVSYDKSNTNYEVSVVPADYTVTAGTIQVTAEGYEGTYDGEAHSARVTARTGELFATAEIYYSADAEVTAENYRSMDTECPSFTAAGTHTIHYYVVCDNYAPVAGSVDVTIAPATLKVTVGGTELTYGATEAEIREALEKLAGSADAVTFEGLAGPDTKESILKDGGIRLTTDYQEGRDAGSYAISLDPDSLDAGNYTLKLKSGTLKVLPKQVTFAWSSNREFTYNGKVQVVTATVQGILDRDRDEVTVGGYTQADAKDAGSYTARVQSLAGAKAGNYTFDSADATASCAWKIKKAANRFIIPPSIADWTEGGDATPVAAAEYGTVKYTYSTSRDGTYTETIPEKAGNYWMKATVADSSNYNGCEDTVSFQILPKGEDTEKMILVIRANDVTLTYGESYPVADPTMADVTVEGLPGDNANALESLVTGKLSFTTDYKTGSNAGSYLLVPSGYTLKDDVADEYEIVYQPGIIRVQQKEVTLKWSQPANFVYDGESHSVTATVDTTELVNGDSLWVAAYEESGNTTHTAVKAGNYTARVAGLTGTGSNNYTVKADSVSREWQITRGTGGEGNSFTTELSMADWIYGDTASQPECSAKYGIVTYLYSDRVDGNYSKTQPEQAGDYYVKAMVEGTEDYAEITSDPVPFTIQRAKITIIADDITTAYGAEPAKLTYQLNGKVKQGDDLDITLVTDATQQSPAGEYPITIKYSDNPNYKITAVKGTYIITADAGRLQVTAGGYQGTYDGQPHGIEVKASGADHVVIYYSESELTDANYGSGTTENPVMTNAGSRTVYYYVTADNCQPVSGSKEIHIARKPVTVKAKDAEITYGDKPVNNGVEYSGFVGNDTADRLGLTPGFTYSYTQYQKAGSYEIMPGGLPTDGNYFYTYKAGNLSVGRKALSFQWSETELVYDGTTKMVTATPVGLEDVDAVTINYEGNTELHIGEYKAHIVSLSGAKADSYSIEEEPSLSTDWRIASTDNELITGISIDNWTYGDTASVPRGELRFGQGTFVYSDAVHGTYTEEQPKDAGTYFMKLVADGTADYSAFESNPVKFVIKKRPVTVIADDVAGVVGEEPKELTYSISGTVVEDDLFDVFLDTTVDSTSEEGDYPITVNVRASGNYEVTTVKGVYHLTQSDLGFKAEGTNCVYDGQEHGIRVSVSAESGAVIYYSKKALSDTGNIAQNPDAMDTVPTIQNAGTLETYYYVVQDGKLLFSGVKSVTVKKAELTVTARDNEILQGEDPVGAGVSYEGFVNGEDATVVKGTPRYTFNYKKGDKAGSYYILPSGLSADNYTITYRKGTLTVNAKQEEITITGVVAETDLVYDGEAHEGYMGTPQTEGNVVTGFNRVYRDAEGNILDEPPVNAGTYTVTFSVPDTNKHYKGECTIRFTIGKRPVTIVVANQAIMAGQAFVALQPEYTGFLEGYNADGAAIQTAAVITPTAGADLTKAGKVELEVSDMGELTGEAARNYELKDVKKGILTIVAKPDQAGKVEGGSSLRFEDPNSGLVQITVIKDEENLPKTEIEADFRVEVAEALLDTDEVTAVKAGQDALIYLLLSSAEDTVTEAEKDAIKAKMAELAENVEIGAYLDLSLYKKVGDAAARKITETGSQKVTISITLPENLKQTDPEKTRTYYIAYIHEGQAGTILPEYQDGILTFEADRFSVYAIAYKDTVTSGGDNPGGDNPGGDNPGGDNPGGDNPGGDNPGGDNPGGNNPGGDNPGGNTPGGNNPGGNTSGEDDTSDDGDSTGEPTTPGAGLLPGGNTALVAGNFPKGNTTQRNGSTSGSGKENIAAATEEISPENKDSADEKDTVKDTQENPADQGSQENPGEEIQNTESQKTEPFCIWHWIIAVMALLGIVLTILAHRRKYAILIAVIDTVLMLIGVILGSCLWDIVTMLLGVALLAAALWMQKKRTSETAGQREY